MFYPTFKDKCFQQKILLYLDKIKKKMLKTEKNYAFILDPKALIHDPPTHFSLTCRAYFSALKNNITLIFSCKKQISYNIYNLLYLKVIFLL